MHTPMWRCGETAPPVMPAPPASAGCWVLGAGDPSLRTGFTHWQSPSSRLLEPGPPAPPHRLPGPSHAHAHATPPSQFLYAFLHFHFPTRPSPLAPKTPKCRHSYFTLIDAISPHKNSAHTHLYGQYHPPAPHHSQVISWLCPRTPFVGSNIWAELRLSTACGHGRTGVLLAKPYEPVAAAPVGFYWVLCMVYPRSTIDIPSQLSGFVFIFFYFFLPERSHHP